MEERLQKFLAECGVASRRKCEELIKDGLISVNNIIVRDMGIKVNPEKDIVKYNGKLVKKVTEKVYVILNKPEGYVTTSKEQFNRPKVTDLVKGIKHRVFPVGRLDYNSSGLLLLTNDGEISFKLTHPGHKVDKTYVVKVKGVPSADKLQKLRDGIEIEDYVTSPAKVNILKVKDGYTVLKITIYEGKNRQIRKMCNAIGHDVAELKRVSIGKLNLGSLKKGAWRFLTSDEIEYLKSF